VAVQRNYNASHPAWWTDLASDRSLSIRFAHLPITDKTLRELCNLSCASRISRLELSSAHITDAGLQPLNLLTGLRDLSIADCKVSDAGLNSIRPCIRRLESMRLTGTQVTPAWAESIGASFVCLQFHFRP
jgi:hypothetical protein